MVIGEMWRGKGFPVKAACSAGRARFQTLLRGILKTAQMPGFEWQNTTQAGACVVSFSSKRQRERR
jgi:hypothetical protein